MHSIRNLFLTLAATVPSCLAIISGTPDGDRHPGVGMIAWYKDGKWLRACTGTLIAPDVVLTAGHCVTDYDGTQPERIRVVFDSDSSYARLPNFPFGADVYADSVSFQHHPLFTFDSLATPDVAIIKLDRRMNLPITPLIEEYGLMDANKRFRIKVGSTLEVAGYGQAEKAVKVFGGYFDANTLTQAEMDQLYPSLRLYGTPSLLGTSGMDKHETHFSNSANAKTGGTCYGDSGSALTSNGKIIGVVSYGLGGYGNFKHLPCEAPGFNARVDTPIVRKWILSFLN
jgi:V8-like Glu-specific endopeptidase